MQGSEAVTIFSGFRDARWYPFPLHPVFIACNTVPIRLQFVFHQKPHYSSYFHLGSFMQLRYWVWSKRAIVCNWLVVVPTNGFLITCSLIFLNENYRNCTFCMQTMCSAKELPLPINYAHVSENKYVWGKTAGCNEVEIGRLRKG